MENIYFKSGFLSMSMNTLCEVLKMPYQGESGRFSMYILLPASIRPTGIDDLLAELTPDILYDALNTEYTYQQVIVEFPKFAIEHNSQLIPVSYKYYNFNFCNFFVIDINRF